MLTEVIAFLWGIIFKTIVLWIGSKLLKLKKQDIEIPLMIALITFAVSGLLGFLLEFILGLFLAMILYFLLVIPLLIALDVILIRKFYGIEWKKTIYMTLIYWLSWITIGSGLLALILYLFKVI